MNILLALVFMESGKKVAKEGWEEGKYVYIDEETGDIKWNSGEMYYEHMDLKDEWAIVD